MWVTIWYRTMNYLPSVQYIYLLHTCVPLYRNCIPHQVLDVYEAGLSAIVTTQSCAMLCGPSDITGISRHPFVV